MDHADVVPYLWPELLEKYPRPRDAGRVILQYLYIFGIMEPAIELIDRSLASNDWSEKFNLADKLAALLAQIEPSGMMRSPIICFFVTYSVTILLNFLDNCETSIYQRSKFLIESLSKRSLAAICSCFEFQFRNVTCDRVIVLQTIEKLNRIRPNCSVANWSFYTQAFNIISIDALVDSRELNLTYCLKAEDISKQSSSSNNHYATAKEYRSSTDGMTANSTSLAKKLNPSLVYNQKEQDKENIVQLMASVCNFMIEDTELDTSSKNWIMIARQIHVFFNFKPNMSSFSSKMTPQDLRQLVIFPTFLIHLPKILDKSIPVSKYFMQFILNLLIFCPAVARIDLNQGSVITDVKVFLLL